MKTKTLTIYMALPLIIAPFLSSISHADEDTHEAPNATAEQDPSAVTLEAMVISSEQRTDAFESITLIKKNLGIATDGADILKQTPGISVTRQGGTASDPLLRGLGGTRLTISIDGIPFGGVCNHRMDPATAYVSPAAFDSLSLLKGPQSVKYGNTISGAVNFDREEIRYEELGAHLYSSYLYGSFNQQALSVDTSAGFEQGYLAYTHNDTRGGNYTDGNGDTIAQTFYDTSNDRAAIGLTLDEDTLFEVSGLTSDGVIGNATIHMDVTKLDRQNYNAHFKRENMASWLNKVDIRYNFTTVDHEMDNFSYRALPEFHEHLIMTQWWDQHFAKAEFTSDITPDLELISGLEYRHDSYDAEASAYYLLKRPSSGETVRVGFTNPKSAIVDFDNIASYGELNYQMTDDLRWVTGFRVDSLGTRTGTMYAAGQTSTIKLTGSNQHRRQTLFAGFLRAEYAMENIPVHMSIGYGHAERAADYWEVYSMDGFNLNAEKNNEIDAMMSYQNEAFSAEISAFYSHITDFILIFQGDKAANVNAQRTGAEMLLAYNVTDSVSVTSNIAYTYAQNLTQNTPLAQTPPLEGNIGIHYDDGMFMGSFNTRLINKQNRIHTGYGNVLALDSSPTAGSVTASLQLGYTPHPLVKLRFGIDNLFDKTYTEHLNRSSSGNGIVSTDKLNEPGRAYWGRITIDFDYPASFKK